MGARISDSRFARSAAAAVAVLIALFLGVVTPASAVTVSSSGVTLSISYGGETYGGDAVVTPGTTYTATLQYAVPQLTDGQVVTIGVPEGVTVPVGALAVPSGNTVVESLALNADGDILVTFVADLPSGIDQGVLTFGFVYDEPVSGTGYEEFTWSVDSEPSSLRIIVRDPDDELRPELSDTEAKRLARSPGLGSYVSTDLNGDVTVASGIEDVKIDYVIRIESAQARTGVVVTDTLDDLLAFVTDAGSVTAELTTWDSDGFNKTTTPFALPTPVFAGQEMSLSGMEMPAGSILEIAYSATVADAAALEAALQSLADDVPLATGGNFNLSLGNDAVVDSVGVEASFQVGSAIRTPNVGAAFGKAAQLPDGGELTLDALGALAVTPEGDLVDPVDVTYTLRADLTQFRDFEGTVHELSRNVVITDTLPEQLEWVGPITASGMTLVAADAACTLAGDMSADDCVGMYLLDGRTLTVNVGQGADGSYVITAPARLVSVAGLASTTEPSPQVATSYSARNTASFDYSDARDARPAGANITVTVPKAPGSVIDDPSEFLKATAGEIVVAPGERAAATFDFSVAAGAVEDLREVRLVDEVDATLFDVSDLEAIRSSITGTYAWQAGLTGDDFDVALVGGELVVTTSDDFGAGLPTWVDLEGPLTENLQLSLTLTTFPLLGKQTIEVENSARLEGDTFREYTWTSQATGEATSYGDELELSKLLYAGDGAWTSNLRADIDGERELVDDTFIYRIELIPHGAYSGVSIIPIDDVLPEGLEFLGFVSDSALESGDTVAAQSVDIGGNIRATWAEADGTVEIRQIAGTTLPAGADAAVNFAVRVTDHTVDAGITNSVGSVSATLTPSDGYPLMVYKVDAQRADMVITDRDARFTVTGPGGDVLTTEAYVVDGRLVVEGEEGGDKSIVVPADPEAPDEVPAGEYTVIETVAPRGYALAEAPVTVTLDESGSAEPVTLYNEPLGLYAIGDLVWIDEDADGAQDSGEGVLGGVTVELLDAETGDVHATTVTGDDGRYLFDLLEPGDYRVRFTLTEEQSQVWTLTQAEVGGDDAVDSDADRATGTTAVIALGDDAPGLIAGDDYAFGDVLAFNGVDPTWDAGVVARPGTVAVGDLVWLDEDRDGEQDPGEPGIPGVTLTLVGPDGEPVLDVDGRLVGPQVTGANGEYLFEGLPVLEEGESYTVSIDRDASRTVLAPFAPTTAEQGDRDVDSSLWETSSEGLTVVGEADLTLDFGFVRTVVPQTESGVGGSMPRTGGEPMPWIAAAAALTLLGVGLVAFRRREA